MINTWRGLAIAAVSTLLCLAVMNGHEGWSAMLIVLLFPWLIFAEWVSDLYEAYSSVRDAKSIYEKKEEKEAQIGKRQ